MTIFEVSESILIQLEGRLDSNNAATLQQKLAMLKPGQHSLWVLDMGQVEFIDSAGLVTLVTALKTAQRHRCRLAICSLRPNVRLIFEITQLDRVFEIFDTLTEVSDTCFHNTEYPLSLASNPAAA